MRQIIFLNEANPITSGARSRAITAAKNTQDYFDRQASRLPAEVFNNLAIQAEHENKDSTLDEIRERIADLMSITDRTPQENAELRGLRWLLNGRNRYGDAYIDTHGRKKHQDEQNQAGENESKK